MDEYELLTMDREELLRRWHVLVTARLKPKKVFMKDGVLIAGEKIERGDRVYLQGPEGSPSD